MKLLVAIIFCFVIYKIQKKLYLRNWAKNLTVKISFNDTIVVEGQSTYFEEIIENNKFLPLPILHVKFSAPKSFLFEKEENTTVSDHFYRNDVFNISPHQRIHRKYPLILSKRGFYTLSQLDIISRDLFLTEILALHLKTDASIHVLPKKFSFQTIPTNLMTTLGDMIHKNHIYEDPFEFKGIRNYQPYDSIHSINWKSTARTGDLRVNTFNSTSSKNISLYLNLETNAYLRSDYLQEESIRLASTIASIILSANISFSFYTNGKDIITDESFFIESGSGKNHIRQIDLALSRIDLNKKQSDFLPFMNHIKKQDPKKNQIIIISNYRKEDLLDAYSSIVSAGFATLFIVPEFRDVEVKSNLIPNVLIWEVNFHEKISQ